MYSEKGYTRVSGLDFRLVRGLKKVVVYARVASGRIQEVTHAALQAADGTWTSKLGQLPLIRHRTPQDLNGPSYGQPVAVYVKRR
jgi:type VI secretion system secreted protein VgrG